MRQTCEIQAIDTTDGNTEPEVIGRFFLEDGQLTYEAVDGHETAMQSLLRIDAYYHGKQIYASEQPVLWFQLLPMTFHGTYLWASAVRQTD